MAFCCFIKIRAQIPIVKPKTETIYEPIVTQNRSNIEPGEDNIILPSTYSKFNQELLKQIMYKSHIATIILKEQTAKVRKFKEIFDTMTKEEMDLRIQQIYKRQQIKQAYLNLARIQVKIENSRLLLGRCQKFKDRDEMVRKMAEREAKKLSEDVAKPDSMKFYLAKYSKILSELDQRVDKENFENSFLEMDIVKNNSSSSENVHPPNDINL